MKTILDPRRVMRNLGAAAVLAVSMTSAAQPLDPRPPGGLPIPAPPTVGGLYRLGTGSAATAVVNTASTPAVSREVRGTFNLAPAVSSDAGWRVYQITNFSVLVTVGGVETYWTGVGTYRVQNVGMLTVMPRHRLTLSLTPDGTTNAQFDSGEVTAAMNLPAFDVTVRQVMASNAARGLSLRLVAGTVQRSAITGYALDSRVSQFFEGCLPPCLCPVLLNGPAGGRFGLLPLRPATSPFQPATMGGEWAMIDVNLSGQVRRNTSAEPGVATYRGVGVHQRRVVRLTVTPPPPGTDPAPTPVPTRPRIEQRTRLAVLYTDPFTDGPPVAERWDSGWGLASALWPTITTTVTRLPATCFTRWITFTARPALARPLPVPGPLPIPPGGG